MERKTLRFLFEGGAGLAIEGLAPNAAQAARDAFARHMKGDDINVLTLIVPDAEGDDEFIIDLRRVVALHVAREVSE